MSLIGKKKLKKYIFDFYVVKNVKTYFWEKLEMKLFLKSPLLI